MVYRIRVSAIILVDNKILLVKHVHPKTGFEWWCPPGGGLESIDKNIHECAMRETWEEIGYNIRTNEILYIREFVDLENNAHNLEIFLNRIHAASLRFVIGGQVLQYNKGYAILVNMTRPLRIEFAGAVYHTTSLKSNKRTIVSWSREFYR